MKPGAEHLNKLFYYSYSNKVDPFHVMQEAYSTRTGSPVHVTHTYAVLSEDFAFL